MHAYLKYIHAISFFSLCCLLISCEEEDAVAPESILLTIPRHVVIDFHQEEGQLTLYNAGNTDIHWQIPLAQDFITISPYQGTISPGDSINVQISIDREFLTNGEYRTVIPIKTEQGVEDSVNLTVRHFSEEKKLLDYWIVDAEYHTPRDLIIAVEEKYNALVLLEPSSGSVETVQLTAKPTCVSVRPDGRYAVVGHRGFVSLVNLESREVIKEIGLTFNVFDIVLAPNHWAYVFPADGQHVKIHCLDLTTGNEMPSQGYSISDQTKAKLHPSGMAIYGADNGISPSDFEKYDISHGRATYMYDSQYHGDYSFGGDLWYIHEGAQIVAKSGNVFQTSEERRGDILYLNSLAIDEPIVTLDHSTSLNKLYVISGQSSSYYPYQAHASSVIQVLHATTFQLEKTIELPPFLMKETNGEQYIVASEGRFGFFNEDGNKYYALVKAGQGQQQEWALVSITAQ